MPYSGKFWWYKISSDLILPNVCIAKFSVVSAPGGSGGLAKMFIFTTGGMGENLPLVKTSHYNMVYKGQSPQHGL